jgi:hypothetical protein
MRSIPRSGVILPDFLATAYFVAGDYEAAAKMFASHHGQSQDGISLRFPRIDVGPPGQG